MKKNILKGLFITASALLLSLIMCLLFYVLLPIPGITLSEHIYQFYFFLFRTVVVSLIIGGVSLIPIYLVLKLYKKLFNK
jgi:hypothetical protein